MTLEGITNGPPVTSDNYEMSVSQSCKAPLWKCQGQGNYIWNLQVKKIVKSQEYECAICGNVMRVTPIIIFDGQKHNLADERPNLYQPLTKGPRKCSNKYCKFLTRRVMPQLHDN